MVLWLLMAAWSILYQSTSELSRGLALAVPLHYFALLLLRCNISHAGVKEKGVT